MKGLLLGGITCRRESLEPVRMVVSYVFWEFLLGFLNCDDICMCVLNKQFELLEFVLNSVYVGLKYNEIYRTFTAGSVCLCGVCNHVFVLGLSVRLSWYPLWWVQWLR